MNTCSASHRPYLTTGLVLSLETRALTLVTWVSSFLSLLKSQMTRGWNGHLIFMPSLLHSLVLHLVAALGRQNNENRYATSNPLKSVEVHFRRWKLCRLPSRNLSHQNLTHAHKTAECTWLMILKIRKKLKVYQQATGSLMRFTHTYGILQSAEKIHPYEQIFTLHFTTVKNCRIIYIVGPFFKKFL